MTFRFDLPAKVTRKARLHPERKRRICKHNEEDDKTGAIEVVKHDQGWEFVLDEEQQNVFFNRWRHRGSRPRTSQSDTAFSLYPQLEKGIEAVKSRLQQ